MDRRPLQLALRETQGMFASPRALVTLGAAGVVLGLSGPFGTFADFNAAGRLAYWLAVVVATYAVGQAVALFGLAALAAWPVPVPVRVAVAALATGVPVTLIVLGINFIAYGGASTMPPLTLWGYCTAISLAVVTVLTVAGRGQPAAAPAAAERMPTAAGDAPPPLLNRLPLPQRGRLLALSVKDHYVEVRTDRGTTLVLIRLSDAIGETGGVAGVQIHRSHWVALEAVRRVVRSRGKVLVELPGGEQLPVSRGYMPAARQAGIVV